MTQYSYQYERILDNTSIYFNTELLYYQFDDKVFQLLTKIQKYFTITDCWNYGSFVEKTMNVSMCRLQKFGKANRITVGEILSHLGC